MWSLYCSISARAKVIDLEDHGGSLLLENEAQETVNSTHTILTL